MILVHIGSFCSALPAQILILYLRFRTTTIPGSKTILMGGTSIGLRAILSVATASARNLLNAKLLPPNRLAIWGGSKF